MSSGGGCIQSVCNCCGYSQCKCREIKLFLLHNKQNIYNHDRLDEYPYKKVNKIFNHIVRLHTIMKTKCVYAHI